MPFSCTAPIYSKEDEERDYANLSPEQKGDILDDAYGRNAEAIAGLNERIITQQELDAFDEALENLPAEDNAEAAIAAKTVICPELVERETNPSLFLRRENYNPQKAAKRFATYWNFRVDVFGNERAFLPISLDEGGAYHDDEEVVRMMRESPTYRYILPNDAHGRSVIFIEPDQDNTATRQFSRQAKIKYNFYAIHRLMEQQSSISKGVVWLYFFRHRGQFNLNDFDRIRMKTMVKLVRDCTPFHFRAMHMVHSQRCLHMDLIIPVANYFWDSDFRHRFFTHPLIKQIIGNSIVLSATETLERYGFEQECLPECLGGTYQFNTSWFEE